ncbi:lamin tail domain-containing protein [Hymenobacter sp. B81]|uniref:lamin tail domain-containing protein n=1 Tax=Hymenobacter sp. B81 TaxID=3344878 RepID=UPI0037DC3F46
MLPRLLCLWGLCALPALPAAAQLTESFADGDFTSNPGWTGDAASFQVMGQQLQSNGPAVTGSKIQLVTPSQAATGSTTWEFWANLRLATSAANYADVWLIAEQADLKASTNRGFFVRLGNTADEISLYRRDASNALIINGTDGTLGSTNNTVRVRVTRSAANVWTLERDLTGGRSFVAEGTATDAAYPRSQYAGVLLEYSSANNRSFYFDDFVISDASAPQLLQATVTGASQLDAQFNEPVAAGVAASSFRLASGAVATAAVRDAADPALVHLTFGGSFPAGNNVLEARNVADLYGNAAPGPLTASFTFTAPPQLPAPGQLLITEIFADETAPTTGPPSQYASEFLEIHNPTAGVLDLAGVRLLRLSGSATPAAVFPAGATLLPGEYAVVCGSTRTGQFSGFGKVFGLTNFPSLGNDGDQLLLRARDGRTLFEVSYAAAWYGNPAKDDGGWSLELIDPGQACVVGAANWTASTDATGATPARANSVATNQPDQTPPTLLSATALSATVVRLTFGEKLDSAQVASAALYSLQPAGTVQSVRPVPYDFRSVELTLASALPVNQPLTVSVQRAVDCRGNATGPLTSASFTYFGPAVAPGPGQLLITELMADPDPARSLPLVEFVEIHNPGNVLLDLGGVRLLKPGSSSAAVFPAGAVLRPGEYAVVGTSSAAAALSQYLSQQSPAVGAPVFGLTNFPSLSNGGDQLLLRARDGRTLFELSYSDTWYRDNAKKQGGWTLEMVDAANFCGGLDNWLASTDARGGTPGQPNAVRALNPDRTAPALLRAVAVNPTTVRLYFGEKLDSAQTANPALYALQPAGTVQRVAPVPYDFRAVDLLLTGALPVNQALTVTVQRATDCAGNASGPATSASFALPVAPAAGDVVINEILFNPRTGGVDFVELLNRSAKYVDLRGAEIGRLAAAGDEEYETISTEPLVLAPGQLLVLTPNPAVVQSQYPTSHDPAAFLTLTALPSYADDAGTVLLRAANGTALDRFAYNQNMHLALLDTRDGVSLERIRPDGPSAAANFHSAAGSVGYATPGRRNSQQLGEVAGNQQFQVEPEVFTPDEDGDRDFTTLTYRLDEPGYAASVSVYDAQGRLMRRLVRNETLATTGFFQWDGLTDSGRKAGIGHYLLHIELYRPGGGQKREYKKSVVLGARL